MNRGTGSLRIASQGLSCPFLKNFTFIYPDPTDRPWVSEDDCILDSELKDTALDGPNEDESFHKTCTGKVILARSAGEVV